MFLGVSRVRGRKWNNLAFEKKHRDLTEYLSPRPSSYPTRMVPHLLVLLDLLLSFSCSLSFLFHLYSIPVSEAIAELIVVPANSVPVTTMALRRSGGKPKRHRLLDFLRRRISASIAIERYLQDIYDFLYYGLTFNPQNIKGTLLLF